MRADEFHFSPNLDGYGVAPDGRFRLKTSATDSREAIGVIVNWTALTGKAPGQ